MKGTDTFQKAIESHLDDLALKDAKFMEHYSNKDKNLKDCTTYILNQVKKSGVNGFADSEIWAMAVEYYTTKGIDIGTSAPNGQVVINRTIELTDKEKEEAKEKAKRELVAEEKRKARPKKAASKTTKAKATTAKKEVKPKADPKPKAKAKPQPPVQPTLW